MKTDFQDAWQKVKAVAPKLVKMTFGFDHIDYYDGCNSYSTPTFVLEKGKRIPTVGERTWNTTPKEWEVNFTMVFSGIKQKATVIKAVKVILGYKFNEDIEKDLNKLNLVISGKQSSIWN